MYLFYFQEEAVNPSIHFLFLGAMLFILYFFMIRPQQKKMRESKDFLDGIKKGDRVVTNGGIHGKVNKVNENTVDIEISNGVNVRVEKSFVSADFSKIAQAT